MQRSTHLLVNPSPSAPSPTKHLEPRRFGRLLLSGTCRSLLGTSACCKVWGSNLPVFFRQLGNIQAHEQSPFLQLPLSYFDSRVLGYVDLTYTYIYYATEPSSDPARSTARLIE